MRQDCRTVYQFDELNDGAKDAAMDWYRQGMELQDWSEAVIEDAIRIAAILGIRINTRSVRLMNGSTRQEPVVYFDMGRDGGAYFDGWYYFAKRSTFNIRAEAPEDKRLHAIADTLCKVQRTAFYALSARIDGHDRSRTIDAEVERTDGKDATQAQCDTVTEALQDFASWIDAQLHSEYDYQTSDECIAESIRANEYEFTENGRRI